MYVDWEHHRVFKKEQENLKTTVYKVVPKKPDLLPEVASELLCEQGCKEMFFQR